MITRVGVSQQVRDCLWPLRCRDLPGDRIESLANGERGALRPRRLRTRQPLGRANAALTQPGSGISHVAHLSGLIIGYLYLRGWGDYRKIRRWRLERKLRRLKKKYTVINGNKDEDGPPYIN